MKIAIIALAATTALSFGAAAVSAQTTTDPYPAYGYNQSYPGQNGYQSRAAQLDARLQAGIRTGAISPSEATPIRSQIAYLSQLEQRYVANGLTQAERQDLQRRYRYTREQLRRADPNNSRYARWDRDTSDPYPADYAANYGNRDDDGSYDYYPSANGSANPGYNYGYAQNGRYRQPSGSTQYQQVSQVCAQSNGLKGLFGSLLGASNSCLRVGDTVRSNSGLYAVPDSYRADFPESNAYTFRYLDQNVVQIDRRNSVVTNIYDVRYGG